MVTLPAHQIQPWLLLNLHRHNLKFDVDECKRSVVQVGIENPIGDNFFKKYISFFRAVEVVSVLAYYSDDLSSYPAQVYSFFL